MKNEKMLKNMIIEAFEIVHMREECAKCFTDAIEEKEDSLG